MKTATKARRKPASQAESKTAPSAWEELKDYLATEPMDDMEPAHPEIREALTLIKYGSPAVARVEPLTVALRLLVKVTIDIARRIHYLEPSLVRVCNLLHVHIADECGLKPDNGGWRQEYTK